VEDLGAPSSYLTLEDGARVFSCDGKQLGLVEHVLAAPEQDIFDGIVIDRSVLPGGRRYMNAVKVEEIFERGVLLKLDAAAAESLPEPSPSPGAMRADPAEGGESPLEEKLRRAWDLLSGKKID